MAHSVDIKDASFTNLKLISQKAQEQQSVLYSNNLTLVTADIHIQGVLIKNTYIRFHISWKNK